MAKTGWNDREHLALRGLSVLAKVIYLLVFRRRMDYASGVAGGSGRKICYQTVVDEVQFIPDWGSQRTAWSPTKGEVRASIQELRRVGLVEDAGSNVQEGYKKFLPLATTDGSVQKRNDAGTTQERHIANATGNDAGNFSWDNGLTDGEHAGSDLGAVSKSFPRTPLLRISGYPEEKETTLFGSPPMAAESNVTQMSQTKAARTRELKQTAQRVLTFLNARTGARFQGVDATIKPIMARLAEGYSEQQVRQVIALKVREWGKDPHMRRYLRPKTLFCATNFANYAGELGAPEKVGCE